MTVDTARARAEELKAQIARADHRYYVLDDPELETWQQYGVRAWPTLVVIDPDGYLKLTDRLKDVIKSGGEWISSIDMENAITVHPRITEAAVIGAWHPQWQERPVVLAVTDNGQEVPIEEIHQLLSGSFAKWQRRARSAAGAASRCR